MYSKNDYRYYLENQLTYSDDFLAHYGVKGMKWKQHKKTQDSMVYNSFRGADLGEAIAKSSRPKSYFIARNNLRDAQERGKRRTIREHVSVEQERGKKRTAQFKGKSPEYLRELESNSKKNNFPKSNNSTKKKKTLKQKANDLRKKYGLYREKPKGKKLKGGGNIYVSHD